MALTPLPSLAYCTPPMSGCPILSQDPTALCFMIHMLTILLYFCLLPMAQRSQISQYLSLFCRDLPQPQATFLFPLPHHSNQHSPSFPSSPSSPPLPSPSSYSSSPFPSLFLLFSFSFSFSISFFFLFRGCDGPSVSPFEAMGQRKIGGDTEGGLWVDRLPQPGHACSCSCGKILLTIHFPCFEWRARCVEGNHEGGESQQNVLCSLPSRLARSGATVVPLGLRC